MFIFIIIQYYNRYEEELNSFMNETGEYVLAQYNLIYESGVMFDRSDIFPAISVHCVFDNLHRELMFSEINCSKQL